MKDYNKGVAVDVFKRIGVPTNVDCVVADVFKRIGMPTNINCYETTEQIHKAVSRAYFLGISDAENNTLIKSKSK